MSPQYFDDGVFAITASDDGASRWAGRADILARLKRLRDSYLNRSDSSLDVMWANLGAGKTHALFHLRHLLHSDASASVVAYVELPEQPKRFLNLFERIVPELLQRIDIGAMPDAAVAGTTADFGKALRAVKYGDAQEREMALDWMRAGRPPLRELRARTGIVARIDDDSCASDVLTAIVQLCASSKRRVVIMIDEFQRISSARPAARDIILSTLRTIFSRNGNYLSVVVAAASLIEDTATILLSPELRTIAGLRRPISLPEMDEEEAEEFLLERFRLYRPPSYAGDAYAPFGRHGIRRIVASIAIAPDQHLIPRTILQAAGLVFDEVVASGVSEATDSLVRSVLRAAG